MYLSNQQLDRVESLHGVLRHIDLSEFEKVLKIKTQCLTCAINQNEGGWISWDVIVIDPKNLM
jgi:hypothetical protein